MFTFWDLRWSPSSAGSRLPAWEQDRLVLKTIKALNETFESSYRRRIDFPLNANTPPEEGETSSAILRSLKGNGIPDTVAYLTEEELFNALPNLVELDYDAEAITMALNAPPSPIEYCHFACR